jgi:hypothetical protein
VDTWLCVAESIFALGGFQQYARAVADQSRGALSLEENN